MAERGELVPRPGTDPVVDRLIARRERIAASDAALVADCARAVDIPLPIYEQEAMARIIALLNGPDEDVRRAGWRSKRQLRTALHGSRPKSEWPASLQAAHEREMVRMRRQDKAPKTTTVQNLIIMPAQVPVDSAGKIVVLPPKDPTR